MPAAVRPKLRRALAALLPVVLGAIGAVAPVAPAAALTRGASPPAARADRRATERYLTVQHEFDREILANRTASDAASVVYAGRVSAECPGVLAGAPDFAKLLEGPARPTHAQLSQFEQYGELRLELFENMLTSWFSSDRDAAHAAAAALRPLRWSKPAITRMVSEERAGLEGLVPATLRDLCAHMRSWVASGYRTLPPGVGESEALDSPTSPSEGAHRTRGASPEELLVLTEGPKQRALARRNARLKTRIRSTLAPFRAAVAKLEGSLGIKHAASGTVKAAGAAHAQA
ncbi:MAG TPA: hypothetical protein VHW67_10635 [Solirubrobacteraceae bacterium]|jgi:hypothetical protein|nr:hypothetical protein [Solirubrobacteraceae bacterium]